MTKRFTAQVPTHILHAMGWHNPATYAEVFDYFADNGVLISISKEYDAGEDCYTGRYEWFVDNKDTIRDDSCGDCDTWIECANEAILKAID